MFFGSLSQQRVGVESVSARSISQAFDYLNDVPDVCAIWLDHYLLGKEDGIHLLSEIKGSESKYKDIPVFVVSNTASKEKQEAYMQLGANEYFIKSNTSLSDIVDAISKAINS